ncbi:nickel-dependent hydrogenase large subunit [Shigella flexneri]
MLRARSAVGRRHLQYFFDELDDQPEKRRDLATASAEKWEPAAWPTECRGVGFAEAPRRALGRLGRHWRWRGTSTSAWCRQPGTPGPPMSKGQLALLKRR